MTARDILWGRGGGRHLPKSVVLAGETALVECRYGHRATVIACDQDKPCWVCERLAALAREDSDE